MCLHDKKYIIIEFEDGLQIVPSCWVDINKITCWWPSYLNSKTDITRAILRKTLPEEDDRWSKLKIVKIFGSSDDYIRALDKLAQAEETSNLEDSDINSTNLNAARKKRQQRQKKVFTSSSDDDSNAEQFKTNTKRCRLQDEFPMEKIIKKPPQINSLMRSNKQNVISTEIITPGQCSIPEVLNKSKNIVEIPQQGEKVYSGFEEHVLRKLNCVLTKLIILDNRIIQIESLMGRISNENLVEFEDEISLPIKSMTELDKMEEKLKSCAFLEKMITYVKQLGGNNVNVVTTGILKKLLDDCFAEEFSWDGKRNKKEFKILLIAKVLKKAVFYMCPNSTEMQIKTIASQWLAQAKVRRIRGAKKNYNNEIHENNYSES